MSELDKKIQDIVKGMQRNKRSLIKRYGNKAEDVMYDVARKAAKKELNMTENDSRLIQHQIDRLEQTKPKGFQDTINKLKSKLNALDSVNFSKISKEADIWKKKGLNMTENYMGDEGDEVQITQTKAGEFPNFYLEKPDGSALIDMFFDSEDEAKKYAIKRKLILVPGGKRLNEKSNPHKFEIGDLSVGDLVIYTGPVSGFGGPNPYKVQSLMGDMASINGLITKIKYLQPYTSDKLNEIACECPKLKKAIKEAYQNISKRINESVDSKSYIQNLNEDIDSKIKIGNKVKYLGNNPLYPNIKKNENYIVQDILRNKTTLGNDLVIINEYPIEIKDIQLLKTT